MTDRIRLTMAQALLRYLDHQYVERDGVTQKFVRGVLGIFGHGNVLGLGEALEQSETHLRYIPGHNEQGMVHTAVAFAKQTRRLGIYACTTSIGPGALNMVTAAAGATINRLPVLLLPGDVFGDRQPDPVLQQLEHGMDGTASVNDAFKPVSAYWDRIMRPEQIQAALPAAFAVLTDPAATGAVTLALPQDVQAEAYLFPTSFFEDRAWSVPRMAPDPATRDHLVSLLKTKKHPLVIAGGGVHYSDAGAALATLAETLGIPVVETQAGKGALRGNHPWNMGGIGVTGSRPGNQLAQEADLVIAVGTRLSDFTTASKTIFKNPDLTLVALNVNRHDALKMDAIPWLGDARAGLLSLMDCLMAQDYRSPYDAATIGELRAPWEADIANLVARTDEEPLRQTAALGVLREVIPDDAVIVAAAGSLPGDLHRIWSCGAPHTYHMEYGFSCMGYEVAAALGVAWAEPDREVYALVGDASYLMLHSELLTSLQEGTKITVVVFDNGGYGSINSLQRSHGSRGFGTELRRRNASGDLQGDRIAIDFAQMAQAMGAHGYTARTAQELRRALVSARAESKSCVIDVKVKMGTGTTDSGVGWRVAVAQQSESEAVRSAADAVEKEFHTARY